MVVGPHSTLVCVCVCVCLFFLCVRVETMNGLQIYHLDHVFTRSQNTMLNLGVDTDANTDISIILSRMLITIVWHHTWSCDYIFEDCVTQTYVVILVKESLRKLFRWSTSYIYQEINSNQRTIKTRQWDVSSASMCKIPIAHVFLLTLNSW